MDRRSFLTVAGSAATGSLMLPHFAIAQPKPFSYYSVNAFSGNFATSGKYSDLGVRAAVTAFGNGLGRPIDYRKIDSEGNPAIAVRKVQQAIDQDKARHFGGAALSNEALAIMKEIDKNKGAYITYVGADEVTGKDCNRSTFRWGLPTYGAVNTVMRPLIQQNPKWKKVYSESKKGEVWYPEEIRFYDEVEKANQTLVLIRSVDLKALPANLFTKAWLESKSR